MCGIAGFVGTGDHSILERMTGALRHRGPDDDGYFVHGNVHLGMRRLSIIDVKLGKQPIFNEDRSVVVVYNGEIYNYLELHELLKQRGHHFVTMTDTEAIVHGYEEWGAGVFAKLNGMFAIALYDRTKDILYLARDRMGKKPLYIAEQEGTLYFASELKAILAHPGFKKNIHEPSVLQYLAYDYIPSPLCIWKDVRKLQPAHYAVYANNTLRIERYWEPSFAVTNISFEEAKQQLDALLRDSVRRRLIAEVPLGIFLSGSIDSSAVAYYAAQESTKPIKTFTIGFDDPAHDESKYASEVAQFLGTEHTAMHIREDEMRALVPSIANVFDEPNADSSVIPTYYLSQLTQQSVTVALGGDGADEIAYGYQTFIAYFWQVKFGGFLPMLNMIMRVAAELFRLKPKAGSGYFSIDYAVQKYADGLGLPLPIENQNWLASFTLRDIDELTGTVVPRREIYQTTVDLYNEYTNQFASGFQTLSYLYLKQYLADQVMVKVDRASMANSLETRAPFLDYRIVEFFLSLPDTYKIRASLTPPYFTKQKYILRELFKDKLPQCVFRPKHGFPAPIGQWLRTDLKPLMEELLSETRLTREGRFDPGVVQRLMNEHINHRANNTKKLWNLMVWQLWRERWE